MLLMHSPMLARFTSLSMPITGVALCTFSGGLWHCLGVHGVLCLFWSWASQKDAKHENWCCWRHGHWGGDAAACAQVVAIFPSYPPLWSLLQMVAKCHRSSKSPWICDNGGRFAVNWSAWDHGRHLACHLLIAEKGFYEFEIVVALHLGYSVALLAIDGPIFKIHFGLISRNETAQEWKKNEHYVANNTSIGDNVPVEDLTDDEYNELFDRDAFVYDRARNAFDNGCFTNCLNFWCQPRRTSDAKGEF